MNIELLITTLQKSAFYDLIVSFGIIIVALISAKIFYFLVQKFIIKITKKTKTTLDDKIVAAIKKPFYFTILIIGFYIAIYRISFFSQYLIVINKLFSAVWIVLALIFILRIINTSLHWYTDEIAPKKKIHAETIMPTIEKIIKIFIIAIAAVAILGAFNVEITGLIAGLGIAGLAVALAFQDTLANFFAGIYTTIERPIKVGDYIELESGQRGWVTEVGWRSTKIRTFPRNIVIIPNTKLAQSVMTNYSVPRQEMGVIIPCSVAYSSDLKKVERVTIDVAKKILKKIEGGKKDFEPFMRYDEFGDSGIHFSIVLRVETYSGKYLIVHEFIKELMERYRKEKITIPFPQTDVWIKQMKKK